MTHAYWQPSFLRKHLLLSLLVVSLSSNIVWSQTAFFEKDTSFTIHSAFQKEIKKFPFIQIAEFTEDTKLTEYKSLKYKNLGYRTLEIDVFTPPRTNLSQLFPGILFVHGGGWKSGDRSLQIPLAKALASRGYVTAVLEYRLSPEAKFPAALEDVQDAILWFKENAADFSLNPEQLAISGSSAGGQLAALASAVSISNNKLSSQPFALVDMDGILAFDHPDSQEGAVAARWLGGSYAENPEKWQQASALYRINKDSAIPTLLIGSQYPRFLAGEKEYFDKLNLYGIYHDKLVIENSPHTFWLFDPWFNLVVNKMDIFLTQVIDTKR